MAWIFLFIFCLFDLSNDESVVLKISYYYCATVNFSLYVY